KTLQCHKSRLPQTSFLLMIFRASLLEATIWAAKKLSSILSWENTKKATIDAQLKRKEEELEKKKAKYAEKMKNKKAIAHREAEEKRAMVVARRGEEVLKAEEMAAKYRATGLAPKKLLGCFGA
uniref:Remorin C-terminal domain-containing protein n=1 Tax=Aegilops tauschii subsp. strangulata TaxID=200361 RepID=A0A453P634_AEGTS